MCYYYCFGIVLLQGDTDVEAVGQVYRINSDGVILVWWPDKTITSCYPQDLYLIGEEVLTIN